MLVKLLQYSSLP